MGMAFDLVEPTVQSIRPIGTGSAAMTVRLSKMARKLTCCVFSEAEVASRSIRTPSVPGSSWTGEVVEIDPTKALTSKLYVRRETKTERKRARDTKEEGSEG